ncbi:MAG: hypothetical protein ACR2JY_00440, partial [Chloroflexota bacterium]
QQTTIVAEMADGTCLVEHVTEVNVFLDLVLGFRRDAECLRLTWHATPLPPADERREAGCWPVRALLGEVA